MSQFIRSKLNDKIVKSQFRKPVLIKAIRFPNLVKSLKRKVKENVITPSDERKLIRQLDDITIFSKSTRQLTEKLKDEIFGIYELKTLRKLIPSTGGTAADECKKAEIPCEQFETCYLCNLRIDCSKSHSSLDSKECDHLLPFVISVIFIGIETTRKSFQRMIDNGVHEAGIKDKIKRIYYWVHKQCNAKKSDKNPSNLYFSKKYKRLRLRPSDQNIREIITNISNVRGITDKGQQEILVNGFKERVWILCKFVNIEISAIYELFKGSGISEQLFIPLIIEYYKAIIKLYAFEESINVLEILESSNFAIDKNTNATIKLNADIKNEIKDAKEILTLAKNKHEELLLQEYQKLKRDYLSKIIRGKIILINDEIEDELIKQMIWANIPPLFYKRDSIPVPIPASIGQLNLQSLVDKIFGSIKTILIHMKSDGIIIDQELLVHLISLIQFHFCYFNSILTDLRVPIFYEDKMVDLDYFMEISCQNLFTIMLKMGWIPSYNYEKSVVYLKLKKYLSSIRNLDTSVCDSIFKKNIQYEYEQLHKAYSAESMEESEQIDTSIDDESREYTIYEEDKEELLPSDEMQQDNIGGKKKNKTKKNKKSRKSLKRLIRK